jgi:hypothetical protein
MMECLKTMLSTTGQNPTYIIIDALDECPHTSGITSPRTLALNVLKKLVELRLPNLYVCVTSRAEVDIRRVLESLTQNRLSLMKMDKQKTWSWKSSSETGETSGEHEIVRGRKTSGRGHARESKDRRGCVLAFLVLYFSFLCSCMIVLIILPVNVPGPRRPLGLGAHEALMVPCALSG